MSNRRPTRIWLLWFLAGLLLGTGGSTVRAAEVGSTTFHAQTVDFPLISLRLKLSSPTPLSLTPDTVRLSEDGSDIPAWSIASATPRQIMTFLLDRSSSLELSISDVRRSAQEFLKSLPDWLKIEVISFASDTEINQQFTTDRKELEHALDGIRAWGGTALYDSIFLACDRLHSNSDPRDFRTLVLFTDGRDETPVGHRQMSIKNLDEVLAYARKRNVRIVAIGMGQLIDKSVLQQLARETGGWYRYAPTAKDLFGIFEKISARMKNERHYQISYQTPNPQRDNTSRQVKANFTLPGFSDTLATEYIAPLPLLIRGAPPAPVLILPAFPSQPSVSDKPVLDIKIRENQRRRITDLPPFPESTSSGSVDSNPGQTPATSPSAGFQ